MNKLIMMLLITMIAMVFNGCSINSANDELSEEELAQIADTTYTYYGFTNVADCNSYTTNQSVYDTDSITYQYEYTYNAMVTDMNNIDTINNIISSDGIAYSVNTAYSIYYYIDSSKGNSFTAIKINANKDKIQLYTHTGWVTAYDIDDSTSFTTVSNNMYDHKYYNFRWIDESHILFYYVRIYTVFANNSCTLHFDHSAIYFTLDLTSAKTY